MGKKKTEDRTSNELNGTVEEIVYQNKFNDYAVIELASENGELVTAVGIMPFIGEGESVHLLGEWTRHAEYGEQFSVTAFEKMLPSGTNDILKYLSGRNVHGIGPVTALKIVNRFGEDTFDVIEHHPEWLSDIPGISPKKAAEISQSFREQTGIRDLILFCRDYLDSSAISRIYQKWGTSSIDILRANPYILCSEMDQIGFNKADALAEHIGFSRNSPERLAAGICYVLRYNSIINGHSCLPMERLAEASAEELNCSLEDILTLFPSLISSGILKSYVIDKKEYLFTMENGEDEEYISKKLILLDRSANSVSYGDINRLIEKVENESHISYCAKQKEAIFEAFQRGVLIITGGPGTGKTTLIRALIRIFSILGYRCALAAPTGRAAKRMSEATLEEAKTIHRMLEMEKVNEIRPRFNRNENNPLDSNVFIVDEASMIDLPLMGALLRAIRRGSRLILIGDSGQLPSVGCGNILFDIIDSGVFSTVRLTDIFRQDSKSLIITNAHKINTGELPVLSKDATDFFFLLRNREEEISDTIVNLITERLPKRYSQEIKEQIQVISPARKGNAGTQNLNYLLQAVLNAPQKRKKEIKFRDTVFREGDKIMQIRNNYDIEWQKDGITGIGVFNGDIGKILSIDISEELVTIDFEGRIAVYHRQELEELEHAYAITVHKSQGSEYPVVIIPIFHCGNMLESRNLLYTAVTRAKKMVILVGRSDILAYMVSNNRQLVRYTCLTDRVQSEFR